MLSRVEPDLTDILTCSETGVVAGCGDCCPAETSMMSLPMRSAVQGRSLLERPLPAATSSSSGYPYLARELGNDRATHTHPRDIGCNPRRHIGVLIALGVNRVLELNLGFLMGIILAEYLTLVA